MIWGCMSSKDPGWLHLVNENSETRVSILENFQIPSLGGQFGDSDVLYLWKTMLHAIRPDSEKFSLQK